MFCKNPKFKGEHWQVGDEKTAMARTFVNDANEPTGIRTVPVEYQELTGWWEYKDGTEGGDLVLWFNPDLKKWDVNDFDGASDLPSFIKDELRALDIAVEF